ncbi:MAG: hypothetical protein HY554_18600, partial [Elusimicrobia bacterium]|nr:hypothetical protein [Elusimicrobiota bacterium]
MGGLARGSPFGMRFPSPSRWILPLVCSSLLPLLVSPALATVRTWDGGAGDALWHTAANWNPDGTPGPGDDLAIDVATTVTVSASGPMEFGSLLLGGSSASTLIVSTGMGVSPGNMTVRDRGAFQQNSTHRLRFNAVTVEAGGRLTHSANGSSKQYVLDLWVVDSFTLQAGSTITVDAKG